MDCTSDMAEDKKRWLCVPRREKKFEDVDDTEGACIYVKYLPISFANFTSRIFEGFRILPYGRSEFYCRSNQFFQR